MIEFNNLAQFLDHGWSCINRSVADTKSPGRYPTLATVSKDLLPETRTVVLRKANRSTSVLEIHTDTQTEKVNALRQNPNASLHMWLPKRRLQIRINVIVKIQTGSIIKKRWEEVPQKSRVSYGTIPTSGSAIKEPLAYDQTPSMERFAVLECNVEKIELLHLGKNHTRAVYQAITNWTGAWLAP